MREINNILEQIKSLKSKLDLINPALESKESPYWSEKGLLSELYEEAGDVYYDAREFLLAVKMYFLGSEVVLRESLDTKLNYQLVFLESDAHSNSDPGPRTQYTAEELFYLGLQAQSGIGIPRNKKKAEMNFDLAAQLGSAPAITELAGYTHKYIQQLKTTAKKGYAPAQMVLGSIFETQKDFGMAFETMEKAAQQGHGKAQEHVARYYAEGCGVCHSFDAALSWRIKSARQGIASAQISLAEFYYLRYQNYDKALFWFRVVSQKAKIPTASPLQLSYIYRREFPIDLSQVSCYRKELHQGFTAALLMLDRASQKYPTDFNCQYQYAMACMKYGFDWLSTALLQCYQKNPNGIINLVEADALLTPDEKNIVLTSLATAEKKKKTPLFEAYLTQLEQWLTPTNAEFDPSISVTQLKIAAQSCRNLETLFLTLNSPHIHPSHSLYIVYLETRQKFVELRDNLKIIDAEIKKLTAALNIFSVDPNEDSNLYYHRRYLLSQEYEKAGDLCIQQDRYLIALQLYYEGWLCAATNSLEKKLNFDLKLSATNFKEPLIEEQDPELLFLLGLQAQAGVGCFRHYPTAVHYFQLASDRGHPYAQGHLADFYFHEISVAKNEDRALQLLRQSAQGGNSFAQLKFGKTYCKDDIVLGLMWLLTAAHHGNARALHEIGLKDTVGFTKEEHTTNMQHAAWQGNAASQTMLGLELFKTRASAPDALKWLLVGATQGDAEAQFILGTIYYSGNGVPIDYDQTLIWFTASAEAQHTPALIGLGKMYEEGLGVPQDDAVAVHFYQKALFKKQEGVENLLINLYSQSRGPTSVDAAFYYRKEAALKLTLDYPFNMLHRCINANPDNVECIYHLLFAELNLLTDDHDSLAVLSLHDQTADALLQHDLTTFVALLLDDELLSEEYRCSLLLSLYQQIHSAKNTVPDNILNYLGNYYFESLPNYAHESDLQSIFAMTALMIYQQIPKDSTFYINALDAIMLLNNRLYDAEFELPDEKIKFPILRC